MGQQTVWRGHNREFYLHPDDGNSLVCIFPDGGSCIWKHKGNKWELTAAKNRGHIGCMAKPSFSQMLDQAYVNLTSKCLLED